jgi:DNA-binding NtrC family response regulator
MNDLRAVTSRPAELRADLKTLLAEYERRLIQLALEASGGNQRKAAATLGVLPTTLSEKIKRLGLRRSETPRPAATLAELAASAGLPIGDALR